MTANTITAIKKNFEDEIERVVQSVNEWDDRTSPDDYPEHLLITSEELADILRNFADVTLESLQRENEVLRSALADLTSWFEDGVSIYGPWIIRSGEHGADAAVTAAQSALSSTGDTHGN